MFVPIPSPRLSNYFIADLLFNNQFYLSQDNHNDEHFFKSTLNFTIKNEYKTINVSENFRSIDGFNKNEGVIRRYYNKGNQKMVQVDDIIFYIPKNSVKEK